MDNFEDGHIPSNNNDLIIDYDPLDFNNFGFGDDLNHQSSNENTAVVSNVSIGFPGSSITKKECKQTPVNTRKRKEGKITSIKTIKNPKSRKIEGDLVSVIDPTVVESAEKIAPRITIKKAPNIAKVTQRNTKQSNSNTSSCHTNVLHSTFRKNNLRPAPSATVTSNPNQHIDIPVPISNNSFGYNYDAPNNNNNVLIDRTEFDQIKQSLAAVNEFLQFNMGEQEVYVNKSDTGPSTSCNATEMYDGDDYNEPVLDIVDPQSMYDEFQEEPTESDSFDVPKIFQGDDFYGKPVGDNLVNLVNIATSKKIEVNKLVTKYPIPENCKRLQPPLVEPDIWQVLPRPAQAQDNSLQEVQKLIGLGIAPLLGLLPKSNNQEFKNTLVDSIITLGNSILELSLRRRIFLKKFMSRRYHPLCSTTRPVGETLFGPDVANRMKEIDQSNRLSSSLNLSGRLNPRSNRRSFLGQGFQNRRPQDRRGNFRGRPYTSRGRVRGRGQRPFQNQYQQYQQQYQ